MLDPKFLGDEDLVLHGREALKLARYETARELLFEYCDRMGREQTPVAPGLLASYALTLGHTHSLKEGIEICRRALASERRNPHIYFCLAQLYLLATSRRKALDAIQRGLAIVPDYPGLLRLRRELGVRQPTPIRFLPRSSPINVRLGRLLRRLRSRRRRRLA